MTSRYGIRVRLADHGGQLSLVGAHGIAHRALTVCGLLEIFAPGPTATTRTPTVRDRTTN